jgi:uncharacterized protein (TIGR02118 family)
MIILSAYYRGDVEPANRDRFDSYLADVHMPDVAKWPLLRGLRIMKNDRQVYLDEAPQYYQCIELAFNSEDDLHASLASDERDATKELSARDQASFKDLFNGEVLHTIYTATQIPVPNPGEARMTRCAYYMGDVVPEKETWLDDFSLNEHLPDVAKWPCLTGLRHLKKTGAEFFGAKPQYYHVFELSFADQEGIDIAMASEERKKTRRDAGMGRDPKTGSFNWFRGEVQHTNYTILNFPVGGE